MNRKAKMMGAAVVGCLTAITMSGIQAQAQENPKMHSSNNRMEHHAQQTEAFRGSVNRLGNERSGFERNHYAVGRNDVRVRYGHPAAARFDNGWNGERREYGRQAFEDRGRAWRGDQWVTRDAYEGASNTTDGYAGQPGYAESRYGYEPGALYAYAPGYAYGPDYSGEYGGDYVYGPNFGIGIGPVGIGFGPSWGW